MQEIDEDSTEICLVQVVLKEDSEISSLRRPVEEEIGPANVLHTLEDLLEAALRKERAKLLGG